MDIPSSLAIVSLAALVHASFQLSVSVLTLLSGHVIGAKRSQAKLFKLTTGFLLGAGVMTILLLASFALLSIDLFGINAPQIVWAGACGLLVGVAISIWLFYYRHQKGTVLWVPNGVTEYLNKRTKSTRLSVEAFGLGLTSVIGEILLIIAPILIAALVLAQLPPVWQLTGIVIYTFISLLSLIIIWVLVGSGHSLGAIQKWRESNKYFLQFAAGAGLIVLAFFVYATEILGSLIGFK